MSVSFRKPDLDRLDEWRAERRQTRGSAIMSLLDIVEGRPVTAAEKKADPALAVIENVALAMGEAMGTELSRLEKARMALAKAEAGENAGAFDPPAPTPPQKLKKPDPYSQVEEWDSDGVAQNPPEDDFNQTRRRR